MQRGNTLSSVNDKPTLSDQVGGKEVTVDSDTRGDYSTHEVYSRVVVISEPETFTPFVKTVRSRLLPSSFLVIFFFPFPTRIRVHSYINIYACECSAWHLQNSPARRSLIMHSARWRCATIESSGHILRCARSSVWIDFPRNIFAMISCRKIVLEDSLLQ